MLQQGNPPDIEEISEGGDCQKSENKLVVFVLEDEDPVCFEIEQDADDGSDEVGDNVSVVEFEQVFEDEEKQVIDEQAESRVQYGHQHKPDELRFKISL